MFPGVPHRAAQCGRGYLRGRGEVRRDADTLHCPGEDTCPCHVPRVLTPRAQVLMKQSFPAAVAVYVVCSLMSTVCCLLLPIETRGRDMRDKQ